MVFTAHEKVSQLMGEQDRHNGDRVPQPINVIGCQKVAMNSKTWVRDLLKKFDELNSSRDI